MDQGYFWLNDAQFECFMPWPSPHGWVIERNALSPLSLSVLTCVKAEVRALWSIPVFVGAPLACRRFGYCEHSFIDARSLIVNYQRLLLPLSPNDRDVTELLRACIFQRR